MYGQRIVAVEVRDSPDGGLSLDNNAGPDKRIIVLVYYGSRNSPGLPLAKDQGGRAEQRCNYEANFT